jgi:hypothetical protein
VAPAVACRSAVSQLLERRRQGGRLRASDDGATIRRRQGA